MLVGGSSASSSAFRRLRSAFRPGNTARTSSSSIVPLAACSISRSSMHRRMDDLVDRVSKVETGMKDVQDDVKVMKPVTEEVRAWKQRGIGGLFVVGAHIYPDDLFHQYHFVAGQGGSVSPSERLPDISVVAMGGHEHGTSMVGSLGDDTERQARSDGHDHKHGTGG
ncbi:DUF1515 domain-containing protein [Rhizobium jaguaris]|uniref:DUF1515 domain-containing protein n=2 Tax=Rhizobium jaguaris TaxID=1312183 RepID=A0A387FWB9_9HYPH|nr:DUF1515 domain-containing protein [Rhizobium jaguaris]